MPKRQRRIQKKNIFTNQGFSAFLLIVAVAAGIFLSGVFETVQNINPNQAIPDPNNKFNDPSGKESLQLKTIGFVSVTPPPTTVSNVDCQKNFNTEDKILVGSDPAPGGTANGGILRIWVNDEGAPYVATGEQVNI